MNRESRLGHPGRRIEVRPAGGLEADGAGGVEVQGDARPGSVGAPSQRGSTGSTDRLTIRRCISLDAGRLSRPVQSGHLVWPCQLGKPLGVELDLGLPLAATQPRGQHGGRQGGR